MPLYRFLFTDIDSLEWWMEFIPWTYLAVAQHVNRRNTVQCKENVYLDYYKVCIENGESR